MSPPAGRLGTAGLTPTDGIDLLDRAAEIGLLTSRGGGYYTAHPAATS